MNNPLTAAVFILSTALTTPAAAVNSDGDVSLCQADGKYEARQDLRQEIPVLEGLLRDSKECSNADVTVNVKGDYGWDTTGKITCLQKDGSVAHEYSLSGVESVALAGSNEVKITFEDGKTRNYTLPDAARAKETRRVFQSVRDNYWTLRA